MTMLSLSRRSHTQNTSAQTADCLMQRMQSGLPKQWLCQATSQPVNLLFKKQHSFVEDALKTTFKQFFHPVRTEHVSVRGALADYRFSVSTSTSCSDEKVKIDIFDETVLLKCQKHIFCP